MSLFSDGRLMVLSLDEVLCHLKLVTGKLETVSFFFDLRPFLWPFIIFTLIGQKINALYSSSRRSSFCQSTCSRVTPSLALLRH